MENIDHVLNEQQQDVALRLARKAISQYLESGKETGIPPDDFLRAPAGAFVTLKIQGELRGCIGYIEPVYPLGETLVKCAIAAAVNDPRFPQLRKEELEHVKLEISILSPVRQVKDPEDIEVGKHGIIITLGPFRGLLLPQVATEQGWDRLTFLKHTCRKAGLMPDAWENPSAKIEIFSAQVFGEEEE
jgi:AmmeMemoRadiSam system protein A